MVEEFFHTFNSLYNAWKADRSDFRRAAREPDLEDESVFALLAAAFGRRPSSRPGTSQSCKDEGQRRKYREGSLTGIHCPAKPLTNIRELEGALCELQLFNPVERTGHCFDGRDALEGFFPPQDT